MPLQEQRKGSARCSNDCQVSCCGSGCSTPGGFDWGGSTLFSGGSGGGKNPGRGGG